jgi:hypothetical protein
MFGFIIRITFINARRIRTELNFLDDETNIITFYINILGPAVPLILNDRAKKRGGIIAFEDIICATVKKITSTEMNYNFSTKRVEV